MSQLSPHDITFLFLSLGVLLASARLLGELAQRLGQPALVGELLAGVVLGPTVLGRIAPELSATLFSTVGTRAAVWEGLTTLSIALFLLVAGMQVQLSAIWRRGETSLAVAGFAIPFSVGLAAARLAPHALGCELDADPRVFAFFFATAMAISSPSVVTKALLHLDLYRSAVGRVVVGAAVFNDLVGWMVFAVILGLLGGQVNAGFNVTTTIGLTLLFAALMLTLGRWLLHRVLPWVQAHTSWPGGVLGLAMSLALLAAALTEWIGIHAIFGAFLVGIAIGDSAHLRQQTRRTILDFISSIFAPLFFASVGLQVDFVAKFDPVVVGSIVAVACLGKILGCGLTARLNGMNWNSSWALGFAMNARGSMEIILGLLALQNGLIRPRMFEALVILAAITSMISEPMIRRLLKRRRPLDFTDFLSPHGFQQNLQSQGRWDAMEELAEPLLGGERAAPLADSVLWGGNVRTEWAGPNQEVAICLVSMDSIAAPKVAVGLSQEGIDFGSLAETPVHIIVLVATPTGMLDLEFALEENLILGFGSERVVRDVRKAVTLTEFLAAIRACDRAEAPEENAQVPAP
jgi:Kef-type K+ transport system membrane component KefB